MMHRHVALIATRRDDPGFAGRVRRVSAHLGRGWRQVLDAPSVAAWVFATAPSRLGHRRLARGVLIGLDFGREAEALDGLIAGTWGAYLVIEAREGQVTVLRDPTGRVECWRLPLEGADLLFSHYQDVYGLADRPPSLDWDYLAHHLNEDYLHGASTGLREVDELLPGEALTYGGGPPTRDFRWRPHEVAADPFASLEEAETALRRSSAAAVRAWAGQYEQITLDLSGGLDSAIVLGLLRQEARHQGVLGVNWLMPGEDGDERPYAHAAAALHGIELLEQRAGATDVGLEVCFPRRLMRPRPRILPLGYDELGGEIARRHRTEAFFTGTGGDHLFYDHLPVSAACDYLHHGGSLGGMVDVAVGLAQLSRNTVWGVGAAVVRHRLAKGEASAGLIGIDNAFLSPAARAATDHPRYGHPWVAASAAAAPPAKLKQILNIMELQRHYHRYGRADVAEEVFPLVSQPVMETALRIPAHWFGWGGLQRGLARRAFADLLPDSIANRRSKGGNTTYWVQFLEARLPRIRELLLDGRLARKGLLDRQVMEAALTPLGLVAGKHNLSLTVCVTAELWVRQTEADAAQAAAEAAMGAALEDRRELTS